MNIARALHWMNLLALVPFVFAGCVEEGDDDDDDLPPVAEAPLFDVVPGSTQKICQLTGEYDFAEAAALGVAPEDVPTHNQTFSQAQLAGTDLGASFEHDGKLWFLFGDSFATHHIPGDPDDVPSNSGDGNPLAADATAWSTDSDPTDCVDMQFLTQSGGDTGTFLNPSFDPDGGTVQQDGISVNGSVYIWFSGMSSDQGSSLARGTGTPGEFDVLYSVSDDLFLGVSVVLMEDVEIPGLESLGNDWVVLFGTGDYRASDIRLAVQPLGDIDEGQEIRYFAGLDDTDQPTWSRKETDAVAVVDNEHPSRTGDNALGFVDPDQQDAEGCVGEMSVHYSPEAEAWLALYNCDFWSIELHSAALPWGPFSDPQTLFDPLADGGYSDLFYTPEEWQMGLGIECDVNVQNEGRSDPGSPYGPYVIERYTESTDDGVILFFVMSTWHPYNTNIMSTELTRRP